MGRATPEGPGGWGGANNYLWQPASPKQWIWGHHGLKAEGWAGARLGRARLGQPRGVPGQVRQEMG